MRVMLYPCMFCVSLSMEMFVLCVTCLAVLMNCFVKQFAACLGVIVILLLNVMELFTVGWRLSVGNTMYGIPKSVCVL